MGYDADAAEERHLNETWESVEALQRERDEACKDVEILAETVRDLLWWFDADGATNYRERAKNKARRVLADLEKE